jgi:hypothetical protein
MIPGKQLDRVRNATLSCAVSPEFLGFPGWKEIRVRRQATGGN